MTSYTVADLVAEVLEALEVETAFGVISVHNIPMFDAVSRRNRIRIVPTRGEAGGTHMADGYARASGKLGVMISSTGPGAANTVGGLVEAGFAATPLLHITGQSRTPHLGRGMGTTHDVPDQLGMLQSVGKGAWRVPSAAEALGTLVKAARAALTAPCGPVSVEIPIDIQKTALPRPAALDSLSIGPAPAPAPSAAALDQLAEQVHAARRPMIWLGNGAKGAAPQVARLLDMGFGAVSSWNGRGTVPEDHPMTLGSLNGTGIPMIEEFYDNVDLMLVVGSRLRGHETVDFTTRLPANRIQIDIDPAADGRTYDNTLFVHGDAATVLEGLLQRVPALASLDPGFKAGFSALRTSARAAYRATLGPYESFADQLRTAMPRDAIFARDVTINHSTWGNRLFPIFDPASSIYPVGAGIGQGLSLGIGAALAPGTRKTVAMTGDGGFFLNLGELWTAVQENLDMVILIMNDAGYGVIRHIQDATAEGRRRFESFAAPALSEIAATASIPFWQVTTPEAFGETMAKAIATPGPTMVEVDMTVIGEHPPYFPYGPKAVSVD